MLDRTTLYNKVTNRSHRRRQTDDALIVSRMKSSKMKPSSLILILVIAKEELSYTGVVPATESPMPKSEGVNQKKLC